MMASATDYIQSFDRYEVVAVTLPGAALLLAFGYFYHDALASRFAWISGSDATRASLEALGMFAVAAFVAGHVIQAVAHYAEKAMDRRFAPSSLPSGTRARTWSDPLDDVPANLRLDVVGVLCAVDPGLTALRGPSELDFTVAGAKKVHALRPQLLARVRASTGAQFFETLKVNAGVNRGLFAVSAIVFVLACIAGDIVAMALSFVLMPLFFRRYRDYERERNAEMWIALVGIPDLKR
ncbi:MAG TPA: hypothetical protein VHS78_10285 [Candidatus Elarobacter sp.]|jgi:hypothetical protein|nr:hypothetical protein [Candidatus Elarobacter sp.]